MRTSMPVFSKILNSIIKRTKVYREFKDEFQEIKDDLVIRGGYVVLSDGTKVHVPLQLEDCIH